jgi:hypothetical protein
MIDDTTPRINAIERTRSHAPMEQAQKNGALDWAEWWQLAAQDPVLAAPTARRFEIYGAHADGDMPSPAWHARMPREGVRGGAGGVVLAGGHVAAGAEVGRLVRLLACRRRYGLVLSVPMS